MKAAPTSPPAFDWDAWYASIGGRRIRNAEVERYLVQIREFQYPRFEGPVNTVVTRFDSPTHAAARIKQFARDAGADEERIGRRMSARLLRPR